MVGLFNVVLFLSLQKSHKVLMTLRHDPILSFHFKQMDHFVGLSFYNNFHFALMAHLVKGKRVAQYSIKKRANDVVIQLLSVTKART